jgi:hypothetical protein
MQNKTTHLIAYIKTRVLQNKVGLWERKKYSLNLSDSFLLTVKHFIKSECFRRNPKINKNTDSITYPTFGLKKQNKKFTTMLQILLGFEKLSRKYSLN